MCEYFRQFYKRWYIFPLMTLNDLFVFFQVTLVTFLTYVFTSDTGYLSAQKAFTSLALFNILRFPINLLPMMISYVIQVKITGSMRLNILIHSPTETYFIFRYLCQTNYTVIFFIFFTFGFHLILAG